MIENFCGLNKLRYIELEKRMQHLFEKMRKKKRQRGGERDCKIPSHNFFLAFEDASLWRSKSRPKCFCNECAYERKHFILHSHCIRWLYYTQVSALWSFHCMHSLTAPSPYCTLIWTWHRHFMPAACFIKFTSLPNHTSYLAFVPQVCKNDLVSSSSELSNKSFLFA